MQGTLLAREEPLPMRSIIFELPSVVLPILKSQLPIALLEVMNQIAYMNTEVPSNITQYLSASSKEV